MIYGKRIRFRGMEKYIVIHFMSVLRSECNAHLEKK